MARSQLLMLCNGIFNEIMTEDIMRINDNIMGIYHQANMIWVVWLCLRMAPRVKKDTSDTL